VIEIAGYRVTKLVGRGATASVYHAVQLSLEREVAIKVLHPELAADPKAAARFLDEARLLAGLSHPHVVPVWDVGVEAGGLPYFSMRYLPGGDLAGRIADGPLDPESLARILFGLAKALEHIHARGLVHRDVTPGNILFDLHGAPYLTDFGVARGLLGARAAALADLAPAVVRYASPEQIRGAVVDHRADLYSLGVVAYEALCGRVPFDGGDPFVIAYAHVFEPPPPLPPAFGRWRPLVEQALAKLPEDRIPNAAAMAAMVERCAPEQVSGLHAAIRAPHLEHIRTLRPEEPALPGTGAAVPPQSDHLATHVAEAGSWYRGAPGRSGAARGPGGRGWWLLLPVFALALVVAGWLLWPRAPDPAMGRVPTPAPEPQPDPLPERPSARPEPIPDSWLGPRSPEPAAATEPEADLDLEQLPTVQDPVLELVRRGRALLAAQRLMMPPGASAHDRFRLALEIDPNATEAKRGLADVGRAYLALANAADTLEARLGFWARGLESTEGVDLAEPVRAEIRAALAAERDLHLSEAQAALARWDGEAARAAFERALLVDPHAPGAAEGLEEAARVGRPGYRFRDALGDAGEGPELVVVGAFALGVSAVTVAEFRRFWRERGAALEAARPSCRDRESGWRASRRRTWEDPGFEQGDAHPVVCVGIAEAEAYVRWLGELSGQRYRLPRASEWLVAWEGPAACADANRGDQRFRARYGGRSGASCDDGFAETSPVRRFAAVGVGLYDMDGNVREWSADCAVMGRGGCRERLALGSAWLSVDEPEPVQRALSVEYAYNSVGFRVLRELD
jgi:serine/threonine-protein kinase PpkA